MEKIELYIFVIVLLFVGSCEGETEPIPAYLHIEPFDLEIVNNTQGSDDDSKLKDAWLTANVSGDFLGVYELPATLPILAEGITKIIVEPGILENGIANTPNIYPFIKRYEIEVDLAANEIDTIRPIVQYDSRTQFAYLEDFNSNNTLSVTFDGATNLVSKTTNGAFEGSSATFTLDENTPLFEVAASTRMQFTESEKENIYLEMHYKNEGIMEVGLVGYNNNGSPIRTYFIALTPSNDWNKIYINLTDQIGSAAFEINEFQVLFGASLPTNASTSSYFVDNLKVVHF